MDAPSGIEPELFGIKIRRVAYYTKGQYRWWVTRESNPVCLSTPDLQSGAVANAARHPKLVDPVGLEPTTYRLKARCSTY